MSKPLRFQPRGTLTAEPTIEQAVAMADVISELADEVLAAEDRIKDLILEAIDCGDLARATEIAQRWKVEAPMDLLESLDGER